MPDHTLDRCYVLNPELRNPFHNSQKSQDPFEELAIARRHHNSDGAPPPRLLRRIKDAESLAFDRTPPEIQRHDKIQRIQGWYPARQAYVTLPMYGAVVDQLVKYNDNVFNQPLPVPTYRAFDTSSDVVMCSCSFTEGYECNLEHWVREVIQHDGRFGFSDRSENAFTRIMREGFVDPGATFEIR